jgi:NAD(P)-dependent dehydrogenase (short-subunit alcohol dehydrogenase family)
MAGRLEGLVAVITGAASGIGRGTVDLFVSEGARVIAADIQDEKGGQIEDDHKGRARYFHCDVTKERDVEAAVAAAMESFGRLDCLFNNAGTQGPRDSADGVTAEGFDQAMHLQVRAALFGIKYAVPAMKAAGGGSIISTSSVAGLQAGYGPLLYSTAKAAIIHMTKSAAYQLGPFNIRVNCICPGIIATNIFAGVYDVSPQIVEKRLDSFAEAAKSMQPVPRGGLPRDIAEAALYLAGRGSGFVTGHALVVDGGLTLGPNDVSVFDPLARVLAVNPSMP